MPATQAPYSQYFDKNGQPLDAGYVWFGLPDENPKTSPVNVYWDADLTQPASQPIRTLAGYLARNGSPAQVFTDGAYSQIVENKRFEMVYYAANSADYSDLPIRVAVITATDGQTLVNLPFAYTRGNNSLAIYLNGLLLLKDRDYTETSTTSVTMIRPLKVGPGGADEVTAIGGRLINAASAIDAVSAAALAAGSGAGLVGYDPGLVFPANTVGERLQQAPWVVDAITTVDAPTLGLVAGNILEARGRVVVGDVNFGFPFIVESSGTANNGTVFNIGGGLFARLQYAGGIQAEWFGITTGVVLAAVAEANAAAIESAIVQANATNAGRVELPSGQTYVRLNPANYDDSSANYRVGAVRHTYDNVTLCGKGQGATELLSFDTDSSYMVLQMARAPLQNGIPKIFNSAVMDMTIDGNFTGVMAGNNEPTGADAPHALISAAGLERCQFRRLFLKNSADYGIGLQNGGYIDNTLDSIIIENVGTDAIDVKDNPPTAGVAVSRGNVISNLTIRNFGQWTNVAFPYAGLDLLGQGWRVSGVYVTDYGASGSIESAIRLKQGSTTDTRGNTPEFSTVSNFVIEQTDPTVLAKGIVCKSPFVSISTGTMQGVAGNGVELEQPFCTVNGVTAYGATGAGSRGFSAIARTDAISAYAGADDAQFMNCVAYGFAVGLYSERTRVTFNANVVDTCTTGVEITSASGSANRLLFNSVRNTTTPLVTTNNSAHQFVGNVGITGPMIGSQTTGGLNSLFYLVSPDSFRFYTGYAGVPGTWGGEALRIAHVASAVNNLQISGAIAGNPALVSTIGTDTDIDLRILPKGAGVLRFGVHTANADAPITGFITIKDAAGTSRKLAVIT